MHKLCRIDIGKSEEILEEPKRFAEDLKERFGCDVYLYGSRRHLTGDLSRSLLFYYVFSV
jgi:hypothetical protein